MKKIDVYKHFYFPNYIDCTMNSSMEKQLKTLAECKTGGRDISIQEINRIVKDLRDLKQEIENKKSFNNIIKMNRALGDKNRTLIFQMLLKKEEMCICEMSIALEKTQPTISHHIQKLEEANLIEGIKSGKFIHYRIKKKSFEELFREMGNVMKK